MEMKKKNRQKLIFQFDTAFWLMKTQKSGLLLLFKPKHVK